MPFCHPAKPFAWYSQQKYSRKTFFNRSVICVEDLVTFMKAKRMLINSEWQDESNIRWLLQSYSKLQPY